MFSSNPFQKLAQGPKSGSKLAESVKTNVAEIKPSLLTHTRSLITDHIPKPHIPKLKIPDLPKLPKLPDMKLPSLPKIPIPKLPNIKLPSLPHIPIPKLPNIKLPSLPHIPFPHLPSLKLPHLPSLSKLISPLLKIITFLLKIITSIPHLKLILMIISGAMFGLIALVFLAAAIAGSIYAPGVVLPILGVILILGVIGLIIVVVVFPLWYFFWNDRDFTLFVLEYFGKGITRKYTGKVVWVVGASTSLGQAMALELAKAGAKIILSSRRPIILQKLKADCIEISKGKLFDYDILVLPFAVTEMNEKYVQDAIEHFGKIDVLIDNISHIELEEAYKTSIGMDKAIFEVNFFGPIFLIKHVIRHFQKTDGGQIIVVSSISGKFGIPGQATSSASKQALNIYFECLRYECAGHNIDITTVCPGLILSSVTDHSVLVGKSLISQDEQLKMTRNAMKTSRCAHLILVAGANRLTESWVSNQPFLFYIYVAQYSPWIHRLMMKYIFSEENLHKIYDGKSPNIRMWRPQIIIL